MVELEPFVIEEEQLAVSVYARTNGDRKYAVRFAEEVLGYTFESLNEDPGYGLVIVGEKGEPHPMFVFYQFLKMSEEGLLDPELQPAVEELTETIQEWKDNANPDKKSDNGKEVYKPDFDTTIRAMPFPLEGVGSKLYQIAWVEAFDEERIDMRLKNLTQEDLDSDDLSAFDWVFFLPHKGELGKLLDKSIDDYLEHKVKNFLKGIAIRSAVIAAKPWIKGLFERLRKGMFYMTLLRARTDLSKADIDRLMQRFIKALEFKDREDGQSKREYVAQELRHQIEENLWFNENPFDPSQPLEKFDPADYEHFEGKYKLGEERTYKFRYHDGKFLWQYRKRSSRHFFPIDKNRFLTGRGDMILEFLFDEDGEVIGAMERWKNRRRMLERKS